MTHMPKSVCITLFVSFVVASVFLKPACISANPPVTIPKERASEILLSYPKPKYPLEARKHRITGMGIFEVRIEPATGLVTSVTVIRSTGFTILDRSATDTLKRWKFRPNTLIRARIPITFSL